MAFGPPPLSSSNVSYSTHDAVPHTPLVSVFFPLFKSNHTTLRPWNTQKYTGVVIRSRNIMLLQGCKEIYEKIHSWGRNDRHHGPQLHTVWAAKLISLVSALYSLVARKGHMSLGRASADDIQKGQTLINELFLLQPSCFISVWHCNSNASAAPLHSVPRHRRFDPDDRDNQWYYFQSFPARNEGVKYEKYETEHCIRIFGRKHGGRGGESPVG
ncbi:uncharacterized protein FOMMEDRAFT_160321 [Fomitiporia mediterranea MF3/22]|uniref:uncharacterized protein n=1 Tax=Fomitiporia mediterranea (strain MF3/22) TaxID=694068 RepID=UPI000440835B|nr:uncharacterized protein FOMMEDRAFT_160321 [Fomitiporia mediterranea MF3/22]EJC99867.1 hypothetical protein FOMMEDRAFT_160321 [Fomitiporia mediterranea MF3/22]